MGPATSLSSMMCWSILPNGFRTASVCLRQPCLSKFLHATHTFILMCPKFTPNSSTTHYQHVVCGFVGIWSLTERWFTLISMLVSFSLLETRAQHTLLCQKLPATLSATLKSPRPSARLHQVPKTPHRTGMDMPGFVERHSLPGMA